MKSGFEPVSRTISIKAPHQSVIVSLVVAAIEKPDQGPVVQGKIADLQKHAHCRWVRLVPVFASHEAYDVVVNGSGLFRLEDVRPGTYTAMVLGREGLCAASQINILFRALQSITLSVQP